MLSIYTQISRVSSRMKDLRRTEDETKEREVVMCNSIQKIDYNLLSPIIRLKAQFVFPISVALFAQLETLNSVPLGRYAILNYYFALRTFGTLQ